VVPCLQFWLALVIGFELTVRILILSRGSAVKVGLVGAILFFLFLVPFWWQGGITSEHRSRRDLDTFVVLRL
jgi:hypothetical protein